MAENKLSIFLPKKDKCDFFTSYSMGHIDVNEYEEHIAHKDRARQEKENDTNLAKNKKQKN